MHVFKRVILSFLWILGSIICLEAQSKKTMTPEVFTEWRKINDEAISHDGKWLTYSMSREQHDDEVVIYHVERDSQIIISRAKKPYMTNDGSLVIMDLLVPMDTIKALKRKKVKKDQLPNDTLAIYQTFSDSLVLFPNVDGVRKSKFYSEFVAFKMKSPDYKKDTILDALEVKKQSDVNGNHLIVFHPALDVYDTIKYVKSYEIAEKEPILFAWTTGLDTLNKQELLKYDGRTRTTTVILTDQYFSEAALFLDEKGSNLAAVVLMDSLPSKIAKRSLLLWNSEMNQPIFIIDTMSTFVPDRWRLPDYAKPEFDKEGKKLFFGLAPIPMVADTNLLEEEIVNVEVWHHDDPYLYTMQESREADEKKRSYLWSYDLMTGNMAKLCDLTMPEIKINEGKTAKYGIGWDDNKYLKSLTWEGNALKDLYRVDLSNGNRISIADSTTANPQIDSSGNHVVWFERSTGQWRYYDLLKDSLRTVLPDAGIVFYDEDNDVPAKPGAYGFGGWMSGRNAAFFYDRYDIWKVDFDNDTLTSRITYGRGQQVISRIIDIVSESSTIDLERGLLLKQTDERTKDSGYALYDVEKGRVKPLEKGPFNYRGNLIKAKDANVYITTRENFHTFPDLLLTDSLMGSFRNISNANPQQNDYKWGSIELFSWENPIGEKLRGLLVKPDDFDPRKKYPLLVNFYERSSDELHTYRSPLAGRSSINYSYYANKGYVIFNPDVTYREGYPGPSCEEDVLSGIKALTSEGYIDTMLIGIQGHSWGGYQVAHLLTKTGIFKCAEAGAPVVNMTSAYGGIRWESGMSRMFQYEKTQSRIGATLWEKPELYLQNSPLFNVDKVTTPVLILHNDGDGAVPWYQGIEFYMAMRRLGKQAWMLNYNGEPHWPVKWQNRLDFNIRMEQFFDYYLMGKEMPQWMVKGIPSLEKGINKGY